MTSLIDKLEVELLSTRAFNPRSVKLSPIATLDLSSRHTTRARWEEVYRLELRMGTRGSIGTLDDLQTMKYRLVSAIKYEMFKDIMEPLHRAMTMVEYSPRGEYDTMVETLKHLNTIKQIIT